jgi:hypothetical protein
MFSLHVRVKICQTSTELISIDSELLMIPIYSVIVVVILSMVSLIT